MMDASLSRFLRQILVWLMLALPAAGQTLPTLLASSMTGTRPLPPDQAFRVSTARAADGRLAVNIAIAPGYHLYRDQLTAKTESGAALAVDRPPGVIDDDPNFGRVTIWRGAVAAQVMSDGGAVVLGWQGCADAGVCYPPQSRVIPAAAGAVAAGAGAAGTGAVGTGAARAGPTPGAAPAATAPGTATAAGGPAFAPQDGLVAGLLTKGGAGLLLLAFFGFGLLLAFTPCSLPMVPVVAGMLAAGGQRLTPGRGAALTGAYVVAVASAFGLLGLAAAWSGRNLQVALQSPPVIWAMVALFVLLALGSFGLFELQMPQAITRRLSGPARGRGTLPGAFLLGLTSALVIGPCVTAPLAGALLYIGQTGNAALGAAALFALGLGQGMPLMAVGIFGSAVLPRMGPWMQRVREVFGFVFLGFAVWMAGRVLPGAAELALWAVLLIGAGVFLGGLDRLPADAAPGRRLATTAGLLALLAGAVQGVGAASGGSDVWQPLARLASGPVAAATGEAAGAEAGFATVASPEELKAVLAATKGPALIYVTAGWCTTCQDIARQVLPDPAVQAALKRVTPIKVDVTDFGAGDQALLDQLGSVGPPTFVFLDAAHREVPGTRLVGSFGAAQLIAALDKAAQ